MTKKEQSDLDLELRADKRLLGRLKTLRKHYQSRHNKIMDQRRAHVAQLLGDYPTERDAQEAYGYDMISEGEYETILAAIEKGEQEVVADSEDSIIVVWLNMWIHAVDNEIQELTYQRMTPAEKEAHDQSVEDWKKHIEELRKKHGR